MKEKWMKFFRTGINKIQCDPDRALKNRLCDNLFDYISDEIH